MDSSLVMINPHLVHSRSGKCPDMIKAAAEYSQGRGCYITVKATQVAVYKIPGCRICFGSVAAFRAHLQSM